MLLNEASSSMLRNIIAELCRSQPAYARLRVGTVRLSMHPCSKQQGILAKANKDIFPTAIPGQLFPAMEQSDAGDQDAATSTVNSGTQQRIHGISLVIAGGGTGGHLFPGIAIAEELLNAAKNNQVRFIGTGNPFETKTLNRLGFDHKSILVQSLKGGSTFQKIKALITLPIGIFMTLWQLITHRPHVVLGMGGYSAGPVLVAAWMLGIPRVIHEQNVIPGMTNRLLSHLANRIYVSFENTRITDPNHRVKLTGNPVRKEILDRIDYGESPEETLKDTQKPFTVMIVGGSQGAHRLNTVVTGALPLISSKKRFVFIHQTGPADVDWVRQAYTEHGITSTVKPFFNHMEAYYEQADLVICRAGASTLAELAVMGKGVVFVPYPFAADDHQAVNADQIVSAGAAEMLLEKNLNEHVLAKMIDDYVRSPDKLKAMATNLKKLAKPDAAKKIVADLYELTAVSRKA